MATIVNNPPANERYISDGSNGMGFLVGIILLVVFLVLLFFYGLPAIGSMFSGGGTNLNVPNKIDVNLHNGTK